MTYIHSDIRNKSILNLVLTGLIFTALGGVFWLVALYNNVVNLNHNIAAAKSQLDSIGAQTTALNSQVTAALGNVTSGAVATADGLVQDNRPQYFPVSQTANTASNQNGLSLRNSN
jgi:hypothetical protein